jgi:ankyrin repeat protein
MRAICFVQTARTDEAKDTTALMKAAMGGHLQCVDFLLSKGAVVDALDSVRYF